MPVFVVMGMGSERSMSIRHRMVGVQRQLELPFEPIHDGIQPHFV